MITPDDNVGGAEFQAIHLRHLVAFAFPGQPLVVERIGVRADVDGLPMDEIARPLADVEHP